MYSHRDSGDDTPAKAICYPNQKERKQAAHNAYRHCNIYIYIFECFDNRTNSERRM